MRTEASPVIRSRGLATFLLVFAQAILLGAGLLLLSRVSGGFGWLMYMGGLVVPVLLVLLLLQSVAATAIGLRGLKARVSPLLHLIAPASVLAVGFGGRGMGLAKAVAAATAASPVQMQAVWADGLARADLPLAVALLVAGVGGLSALVSVALAAFVRRGETPSLGLPAGVFVLGLLATFTCLGYALTAGSHGGRFAPSVFIASMLFFGTIFSALAASGLRSLAGRSGDTKEASSSRAEALGLAMVASGGFVGGLLGLVVGLVHFARIHTLQILAYSPLERRPELIVNSTQITDFLSLLGVLAVAGATVIAVALLAGVFSRSRAFLARPALSA